MADAKKDSKTTWAGIAAALGVILIAVGAWFDGDPSTKADMPGVIEAAGYVLSAVGLGRFAIKAKDKDDA